MHIIAVENRTVESYPQEIRPQLRTVFGDYVNAGTEMASNLRYIVNSCGGDMDKVGSLIVVEFSMMTSIRCSSTTFRISHDQYLDQHLIKIKSASDKDFELEAAFAIAIHNVSKKLNGLFRCLEYFEAMGLFVPKVKDRQQIERRFSELDAKIDGAKHVLNNLQGQAGRFEKQLIEIGSIFHEDEDSLFIHPKAMPEVMKELSDLREKNKELQDQITEIRSLLESKKAPEKAE